MNDSTNEILSSVKKEIERSIETLKAKRSDDSALSVAATKMQTDLQNLCAGSQSEIFIPQFVSSVKKKDEVDKVRQMEEQISRLTKKLSESMAAIQEKNDLIAVLQDDRACLSGNFSTILEMVKSKNPELHSEIKSKIDQRSCLLAVHGVGR